MRIKEAAEIGEAHCVSEMPLALTRGSRKSTSTILVACLAAGDGLLK